MAFPVDAELPSTAELLTDGMGAVRVAASAGAGGVPAERLSLLSPVTTPCRVVAQAVNYRSHAQDAGVGDDPPPVFFRQSSASVSAPTGERASGPPMCGCSTTSWRWGWSWATGFPSGPP